MRLKAFLCTAAIFLFIPLFGAFSAGGGDSQDPQLLKPGVMAPEWTLKDAAGKVHRLSDFKGKLVLMDFWATWCGPCRLSMPEIGKIYREYGAKGVVVLGMNVWENADPVKFMRDNGYDYTLLLKADGVAAAYQVQAIPAVYLIDGDGRIYYSKLGYSGDAALTDKVAEYLKSAR
jgi:thiol-disulfide isomerase/thioredoxin